MKIVPIQNYGYKNINFKSSAPANMEWRENLEPKDKKPDRNNMPEWVRKSILGGLVTLAIVNDPAVTNYMKSENIKQQENAINKYFKDVSTLGMTVPAYHLNRLGDIDKPIIISERNGNYNLEINLDNGKKINFDVNISDKNENILYGYFTTDGNKLLKYKAEFNSENPDEFSVQIRSKDNKKYIFGRKPNGELYQIVGKKKIVLNRKNAQKYQNELKQAEEFESLEFFTNKNDLWRKLNLILLFFLTLNEWGHDIEKRDCQKNKK